MPRYDYGCPIEGCTTRQLNVFVATWRAAEKHLPSFANKCPEHQVPLMKLPSAPNFAIKGFNAKGGYSK